MGLGTGTRKDRHKARAAGRPVFPAWTSAGLCGCPGPTCPRPQLLVFHGRDSVSRGVDGILT